MASPDSLHFLRLTSFLLVLCVVSASEPRHRCYDSIISFGDSIADTGNLIHLSDTNSVPQSAHRPYGETFFHHPTGRYSDGRIIIDFIAESLGLPFVPPYFGSRNGSLKKGMNFAVAGATALDVSFFDEEILSFGFTNVSLGVQISIFKQILPSICVSSSDCSEFLGRSLILVGEIGGNDYNYPFFTGRHVEEIRGMVPFVINAISLAIKDLVDMGGRTFLVPGNFPIGCIPSYLTIYQTENEEDYDPLTGCLKWLNEFAEHHNEQLQTELNRLRKIHPRVDIMYADYYNAISRFYKEPTRYGFMKRPLSACCGIGGPYNYSVSSSCGYGVPYCEDPSAYVNWDGLHLTEAAYRWVARGLLEGPYSDPAFNSSFLDSKLQDASPDKDMSLSI